MKVRIWEFKALDTLFFRDSTPHDAGEGGGTGVKSLFPPYIFTLQGAIRTGLALGQGWTPRGEIPFPAELGDGDNLGQVSFEGPYFKQGKDYLFQVPLNLLHRNFEEFSCVEPGTELFHTDMGKVRLPKLAKAIEGAKIMNDYLITGNGFKKLLNGEKFRFAREDFVEKSKLWHEEERAGIAIDRVSGTSKDRMLYFTSHIRPEQELSIAVKVKGIDEDWHRQAPSLLSLGGEGRMAAVHIGEDQAILPPMPDLLMKDGKTRFTATLLTPGCIWPYRSLEDITKEMELLIEKGLPSIPGNCISACIGKMHQLGGFDLAKREPRPLIPVIQPGSMWFYEGEEKDIDLLQELHGKVLNPLGFNQIIIGIWGE